MKTIFVGYLLLTPAFALHIAFSWGHKAGFRAPDGRVVKVNERKVVDSMVFLKIDIEDQEGKVIARVKANEVYRQEETNYACLSAEFCFLFLWGDHRLPLDVYRLNLDQNSVVCTDNSVVCHFERLDAKKWQWLAQLSRTLDEVSYLAIVIAALGLVGLSCVIGIKRLCAVESRTRFLSARRALLGLRLAVL